MQEPKDLQPAAMATELMRRNLQGNDRLARARAAAGKGRALSAEDEAKLADDHAKLEAVDFGDFVEASGQVYVMSAFKGERWLERVPKLMSFKQRQKVVKKARQAAREQGLLK